MAKPQVGKIKYAEFGTEMGPMLAAADTGGLIHLTFQKGEDPLVPGHDWVCEPAAFKTLAQGVRMYLSGAGELPKTTLGNLGGTEFQRLVWKRLQAIPSGRTCTYGDIAKEIGRPKASRAVGAACGANPVPLFIPCHRVVGAKGSMTGFSCGIGYKRQLLKLEGFREKDLAKV